MALLAFAAGQSLIVASTPIHVYGLDPSSAADRAKLRGIIDDIGTNSEHVVEGTFRGQGPGGVRGPVDFRIRGADVVA